MECGREPMTQMGPRTCLTAPPLVRTLNSTSAMSGTFATSTRRGALAQGAADHLTKPFPLRYLDAVLAVHLPRAPEPSRA